MTADSSQPSKRSTKTYPESKPRKTSYPTKFGGKSFTSRLEARWAAFFEALRVPYEYEPLGWYGIDFYLPSCDKYLEIKVDYPSEEERRKIGKLVRTSGKTALLAWGNVWPGEYRIWSCIPTNEQAIDGRWRLAWFNPSPESVFGFDPATQGLYLATFIRSRQVNLPLGVPWLVKNKKILMRSPVHGVSPSIEVLFGDFSRLQESQTRLAQAYITAQRIFPDVEQRKARMKRRRQIPRPVIFTEYKREQAELSARLPQVERPTMKTSPRTESLMDLCRLFCDRAERTWAFLGKCRSVGYQPREETITDVNVVAFKSQYPAHVITHTFTHNEDCRRGGDWEWWFTDDGSRWIGVRIQAKIIDFNTNRFEGLFYKR